MNTKELSFPSVPRLQRYPMSFVPDDRTDTAKECDKKFYAAAQEMQ